MDIKENSFPLKGYLVCDICLIVLLMGKKMPGKNCYQDAPNLCPFNLVTFNR